MYCAHMFAVSTNSNIKPESDKVWPLFPYSFFIILDTDHLSVAEICCYNVGGHGMLWLPSTSGKVKWFQHSSSGKCDDFDPSNSGRFQ